MNKREFNKILKEMTTGKFLDREKVLNHPKRNDVLLYLVCHHHCAPIMPEMIQDEITASWLRTMGYMYCYATPAPANLTMICTADWYARSVVETGKPQTLYQYNWALSGN